MLKDDQPVTGAHLDIFIKLMGLHGQAKKTLLGLSDPSYTKIMANPDQIISNPPTALLLRYLFNNPEKFFLPKVKFSDLLEVSSLPEEKLSLLIGRHFLSGSRYLGQKPQEMRTAAQRLAYHMYTDIVSQRHNIDYFIELAKHEAAQRGMHDLFKEIRWKKTAPPDGRPITIRELDWFRLTRNLSLRMLLTYIGINRVDLNNLRLYLDLSNPSQEAFDIDKANALGNKALQDASSALLIRYYLQNPDKFKTPEDPTIHELLSVSQVHEKEIGVLLGRDSFSAHRWKGRSSVTEVGLGQSMHWSVKVLANYFMAEVREGNLEKWITMVVNEGKHYGIDNVLKTGSWNRNK
jgi:hypothetical protein